MSRILQFALCSLCEGRFNVRDLRNYHGQRFPLVLQCGHAACEQCIRGTFIDRKAKTIICKVCQQVSNFSGNSKTLRTSFPLHVFLVGQFFLRSSEKQYQEPTNLSPMPAKSHRARKPNQVLCSECEVSSATCFCKQCKAPFCGPCFSAVHQMGKSLRSHVCEDISVIEMTVMCSKHPKIDLDMFCETCDVTICAKCSVLEHKDHMVVSSATKNASILPDLESSLEFAGQVRQRLKLSLKEAEALSVDDSVFLGAERELAYSLIQLHGQMQLLGAQWWRRIEEKHAENTACTHNIQSDLKTYLQDLECAMRTAHLAMQPENVTSANLVSIKDRLDNSLTAPAYVVKDEVSANVLVKLDLAGNQENVIELDLPESTEYRLVSENELPASYDLQQLPPDDFLSILSSNVDLKDQSIVPDTSDSLSNKSLSLTKTSCSSLSSSTSSIPTVVPAGMNLRKQPKPLKLSDPYDGLEKGCMVKVEVSHIISPSDFYVHLYSSLEQLNALTKKLTKESKTCEATKSIQINDCYLVEYEHEWFRGRVVRQAQSRNSNSELYEIEFLDYGNCAPVEVSSIKCLPSKYSSIPCQAIRCALYHVNFSDEVKKSANLAMINLINGHSVLLMHVLEVLDDKLLIDLSHISPEVTLNNARHPKSSIRDSMIYLGYGSFLPDSSEESKTSYKIMRKPECDSSEFVQNLDIPANSMLSVWIMHVDSPSSIYVTPHEFLDSSGEIRMEIDKFVKDDKITKVKVMQPHVGKPVLAKYSEDGLFYRAQILDTTKPGIVQVIFVDYGNVECVQWDNVWHIPQSLLQYPICALHCSLTGISPPQGKAWEKPACQFLKAINHGDFKMKVISRESSNFHVCLYLCQDGSTLDVAELLEKQGFAKFTAPRTFPKQLEGVCDLQQANEEFEGQYSENHHEQDVSQTASQSPFKEVEHICVQEAFESVRDESQSIQELYTPIGSSTNSENNASVSLGVLKSDPSFGILDPEPGFLQLIKKQESSVTKDAFSDGTILSIGKSENSLHVESSVGSLNDSLSSGLPTCCSDSSVLNQLSAEDLKTKSTNSHDSRTPIVTALKGSVAKSSVQSRLMQAQKHMPKNTVLPSVKLPVDVLYCESPNSIYVRVKNHNKKMERLEAELQSYYSTNDDFVSDPDWSPSVHDLCAVKSCEDDFWHRALILQVLPGLNYQVMLKDIGRVESVDKDAIRKLPEVFASVSDGVIRCHLANIKAAGAGKDVWPSISIETLKSLITEHQFKLYIAKKGSVSEVDRSLPVDLWVCESVSSALEATKEEWFTINRVLVDQGVALPIDWSSMSASDTTITASDWQVLSPSDEPNFNILAEDNLECQGDSSSWDGSSDEESIYTDWLPAPPFPQKSFSGTATNVDYDCHVYIHDLPESALILQKVNDALQKKFKNSKPSSDDNFWFPDSLCIAQYHDDQNWYRGKVLKVKPDNSVEVLMVDYGNVEECRSVDLRKAVVCKNVPIMARKCRISGLMPIHNEWTEPVLDKVHSILVDKECHVKVVREPTAGDSIYLVDIFLKDIGSVRDYLCANDLATCTPSYDTVDLTLSDEEEPDVLVLEEC